MSLEFLVFLIIAEGTESVINVEKHDFFSFVMGIFLYNLYETTEVCSIV